MDLGNRTGVVGIIIGAGLSVAALTVPWEIPIVTRHIMFWAGSFSALAGSLEIIRLHFLKSKAEIIRYGIPGLMIAVFLVVLAFIEGDDRKNNPTDNRTPRIVASIPPPLPSVPAHPAVSPPLPPQPMGKEEAAFLLGLSNWLCGKNEGALRLEFDLIGMLENNIDLMTKNHGPLNEKQRNNIDVLFSMGHIRLSRQIAPGVQFGPGDWAVNPGEVGFLVFTNKYKAAETRLDEAILSTLVPSDVVQHLINFRSIVKYDMQGAIEELNYGYKYNPKFIFDSKKKGTPYFAVIRDRYAAKSIGLRPPVEIACDLIGKHLRSGTP